MIFIVYITLSVIANYINYYNIYFNLTSKLVKLTLPKEKNIRCIETWGVIISDILKVGLQQLAGPFTKSSEIDLSYVTTLF